jgi:hypothetical protein
MDRHRALATTVVAAALLLPGLTATAATHPGGGNRPSSVTDRQGGTQPVRSAFFQSSVVAHPRPAAHPMAAPAVHRMGCRGEATSLT